MKKQKLEIVKIENDRDPTDRLEDAIIQLGAMSYLLGKAVIDHVGIYSRGDAIAHCSDQITAEVANLREAFRDLHEESRMRRVGQVPALSAFAKSSHSLVIALPPVQPIPSSP
jgi:hypothetical protein